MNIIEKNEGEKIVFAINGNHITFGDDELTINLEPHEREFENSLDICRDRFGNLVMGVIPGRAEAFVAQILIPPREFEIVTGGVDEMGIPPHERLAPSAEHEDSMESVDAVGDTDEFELSQEIRTPIPFELQRCTLTLWALV